MFHGVFDEVDDGVAFELGERAEAEVPLIVFDPHVSNATVQFKGQGKYVMLIA